MQNKLLTKKGYNRLKAEFDDLSKQERPRVVAQVSAAALEGDRSENAEYIYGKKRLREIDKRLAYLTGLLKDVKIVDKNLVNTHKVCLGSKVTIKNSKGEKKTYTIVGEGEADLKENTISYKAPLGHALMDKSVNDIVEVELIRGLEEFEIISISVGEID